MFIVVEGMDYSGKSSFCQALKTLLENSEEGKGKEVVIYGNPGGTELGKELRQLFKSDIHRSRLEDFFLLCANRVSLAHQIKQDLSEGKIVICDRWDISAHVYQSAADIAQFKDVVYYRLMPLYNEVHDLPIPDYTILLDPDLETVIARSQKVRAGTENETDRYESRGLDVLHTLYRDIMAVHVACSPQWKPLTEEWRDDNPDVVHKHYKGMYHPASARLISKSYIYIPIRSAPVPFADISGTLAQNAYDAMHQEAIVYHDNGNAEINQMEDLALKANANAIRQHLESAQKAPFHYEGVIQDGNQKADNQESS